MNTFEADAHKDAESFVSFLADDVVFEMGPMPPMVGRAAVATVVEGIFRFVVGIEHTLVRAFEQDADDVLIYEAIATFTLEERGEIAIPYVNVIDFRGPLISRYRTYLDMSALPSMGERSALGTRRPSIQ